MMQLLDKNMTFSQDSPLYLITRNWWLTQKNRDIGLPTKNAQPLTWINWDNLGKCFLKKKSRRLHKGSLAFTWIRDLENTCQTNGANSLSLDGKCPFSIGPSKKMNMCPPCLGQKKTATYLSPLSLLRCLFVLGHIMSLVIFPIVGHVRHSGSYLFQSFGFFFSQELGIFSGWTSKNNSYPLVMTNSSPWYRWPIIDRWFTY